VRESSGCKDLRLTGTTIFFTYFTLWSPAPFPRTRLRHRRRGRRRGRGPPRAGRGSYAVTARPSTSPSAGGRALQHRIPTPARGSTSIDVGKLYANEERWLLLFLHVLRARAAGDEDTIMRLVEVSCSYRDTATGRAKNVAGEDAVVRRPSSIATTVESSAEVDRERVHVKATDDIAAARGAHAEGDPMCAALSRELQEMRARVADRRRYELSGRTHVLAGLSAHAQQRATSRQMTTTTVLSGGETRAEAALREEELGEAQRWPGCFGGGAWPHSEPFDFDGRRRGRGRKRRRGGRAPSHRRIGLHHREWSECQRDAERDGELSENG
jgi:hypothetical protein